MGEEVGLWDVGIAFFMGVCELLMFSGGGERQMVITPWEHQLQLSHCMLNHKVGSLAMQKKPFG